MKTIKAFVLVSTLAVLASPTFAYPASKPPAKDVATMLFGDPQWSKAPVGTTITYTYAKTTTDPAFGPSFKDTVVETLDQGAEPARRTVEFKLFSGMNAKPAGPFDSVEQNPVLLVVLEENVQELSKLFHGNTRYLKNAIRKAWRDDATIEPVTLDIDGKSVAGTRITVTPFVNDPERDKMLGLESFTYVVEVSDDVPGQIATIDIHAPATGPVKFGETLRYQSEKKP